MRAFGLLRKRGPDAVKDAVTARREAPHLGNKVRH